MQKHLCGLYFNPVTLEKKMLTILNTMDSIKLLLKSNFIRTYDIDEETAIIMADYEIIPEQTSKYKTTLFYRQQKIDILGSFIIINTDAKNNRVSLNLFKQNRIRIAHVTSTDLEAEAERGKRILYSVIITETETNTEVTRLDFSHSQLVHLINLMAKNNFRKKGFFEYKLMLIDGNTSINIIPSVFSDYVNELFDTESDLGHIISFKK